MAEIRTTHTGSLHRPPELITMVTDHEAGAEVAGFDDALHEAVTTIVADQVAAGIDIVNDGEQGKRTYASYVIERLTGFEPGRSRRSAFRDLEEFPDFAAVLASRNTGPAPQLPACTGPITVRDPSAVTRDIENLTDAASAAGIGRDRLFMSAVSPATVAIFLDNLYYPSREEYLAALGEAMHHEYKAIVDAGLTLQLDCPDLAMRQGERHNDIEDVRRDISSAIEAINAATADLAPEQMRIHLCWGNSEGPHVHDVALRDTIDLIVGARPAGIAIEAANPRHGHEWQVFEEFKLPDDKYILPGVIDTTTNFVEHPELVAQRLRNYTRLLGNERVVATTDCGFGTHATMNQVARTVAWAKLRSMSEGAALASR